MSGWTFDGTVKRWVDGDTLWATCRRTETVDFGFRVRFTVVMEHDLCFRVYGIDTPEDSKGKPAAARARELAPADTSVQVATFKDTEDKYGRWLATITTPSGVDVAAELIREGFGVPYFGGTKGAALLPNPA